MGSGTAYFYPRSSSSKLIILLWLLLLILSSFFQAPVSFPSSDNVFSISACWSSKWTQTGATVASAPHAPTMKPPTPPTTHHPDLTEGPGCPGPGCPAAKWAWTAWVSTMMLICANPTSASHGAYHLTITRRNIPSHVSIMHHFMNRIIYHLLAFAVFYLSNKSLPWDYDFRFVIEEISNINDKAQASCGGDCCDNVLDCSQW